jgi:quinol monooxygenase YgiN
MSALLSRRGFALLSLATLLTGTGCASTSNRAGLAERTGGAAENVHTGLLARLEAKPGKEAEVQKFLEGALPVARNEPDTIHWYAIRLSPTKFGIVDTFVKDSGRQAHLNGQIAAALGAHAAELLAQPPSIQKVEVIAAKP